MNWAVTFNCLQLWRYVRWPTNYMLTNLNHSSDSRRWGYAHHKINNRCFRFIARINKPDGASARVERVFFHFCDWQQRRGQNCETRCLLRTVSNCAVHVRNIYIGLVVDTNINYATSRNLSFIEAACQQKAVSVQQRWFIQTFQQQYEN